MAETPAPSRAKIDLRLRVNDREVQVGDVPAGTPLLDFLHEELGLTGSKFGCGIGVCRACTVAVRPGPSAPLNPVIACSTPVSAVNGQSVYTVEGLARDGQPNRLQELVLEHFAFQCGYCTPGFLMATVVLAERLRAAPIRAAQLEEAIEEALGPHLCRCTGYVRYWEAVRAYLLETGGVGP
jgi:aerobic-type carbon monoxide dehydrogenase small subunit (CoxS/CutS family)